MWGLSSSSLGDGEEENKPFLLSVEALFIVDIRILCFFSFLPSFCILIILSSLLWVGGGGG